MPGFYSWQGNDLVLSVKAQPNAPRNEFSEVIGECIKLRITASPVDGKANQQLIRLLADTFAVSKSRVELLSGKSSKVKRFLIRQPASLPSCIQAASKS